MKKFQCGDLSRRFLPAALLCLGIAGANAKMTLDLRATDATSGAILVDSKHVSLSGNAALGSIITFNLYAVVTGAAGNSVVDEGITSALTTLMTYSSGQKNIHGDLSSVQLDSHFNQSSLTTGGLVQDLNGDGDLDVGGTSPTNTGAGYIYFYSGQPLFDTPGNSHDLPGTTAGREWLLGTSTFTVDGLADLENASILANFVVPIFTGILNNNARALYREDGTFSGNGGTASAPMIFAGEAVTISVAGGAVPEPTALTMVLAAMNALFGTRRRR